MKKTTACYVSVLAVLLIAFALSGSRCIPKEGGLRISLVDDPVDDVSQVLVKINSIVLYGGDSEAGNGKVALTLTPLAQDYVDLLDLQNGLFADLVDENIPTGTYGNMKIMLDDAQIVLEEGGAPQPLEVPPGKLNVPLHGLVIDPGEITELYLVFDVRQSLLLNPKGYKLKPVLRTEAKVVSGSISGTVDPAPSMDEGTGDGMKVAVFAVEQGGSIDDYAASTQPAADGSFTLLPLREGAYDVIAVFTQVVGGVDQDPVQVALSGVAVVAEQDTAGVNLSLPTP